MLLLSRNPQEGVTLIELLTTVALVAIILSLGIPSFQEMTARSRVTTDTNTLVAALTEARSEAIKNGRNIVVLCKKNAGGTACNNSGDWEDGWLLFVDSNADGVLSDNGNAKLCETDASGQLTEDCLIRTFDPPVGVTIRTGNTYNCWMSFQPNGTPRGSGSGCAGVNVGNDTFRVCRKNSTDKTKARFVIVTAMGRIRTQTCDGNSSICSSFNCP